MHAAQLKTAKTDQVINLLKEGLPTNLLDELRQELEVSENALSNILLIPQRTLNRRRAAGRFKTDESERVLRLFRVYNKALDVLGTQAKAARWLKKPARAFGGVTPLNYADTEPGAQEVILLLERLDHGVFPG